jgi:hypothetical protein
MSDPGARELKKLLETPFTVFASASEKLGEALAQSEGLDGDVPDEAFDAITRLREAYAALARRIENIDTAFNRPQDEALAACAAMDVGLEELTTGIVDGYGKPAEKALHRAKSKMERAATALETAAGSIR